MLKVNQKEHDDKILIEIHNEEPAGGMVGKRYKNIGIFLRPSTDYGDIGQERNISASEDYLNVLKDEELQIISIRNLNDLIPVNLISASVEVPLVFKLGSGDGYKRRLSLIEKAGVEIHSILPVGSKIEVELNYSGSVNKRISIEVVSGGVLDDA